MNTYEYSSTYFFFALRAISPSLFFWYFFLYETPAILHLARPINWQKMPSFFRKVSNLFMSNFVECKAGKQFQKKWKISLKFVHHAYNSVNRVNTLSRYLPVMIYHTKTDLGSMTKFLPKIPQLHYNKFFFNFLTMKEDMYKMSS